MKATDIQTILSYFLSQPPCRSGLRLRSEPELGRLFNTSHLTVRRATKTLAEQGYLTRKHGSGTYIRKAFPQSEAPATQQVRELTQVLPEQVFVEDPDNTRHRPEQVKHRLRIGLSADPALTTYANRCIFDGAKQRLKELGHIPVRYSQYNHEMDHCAIKSPKTLAEEFISTHCDGYLIENWWAADFEHALQLAFPDGNVPPVAYFWPGHCQVTRQPLVDLDSHEAIERAVRLLYGENCRRIAILSLEWKTHRATEEYRRYDAAMNVLGLDYRSSCSVAGYGNTSVPEELDRLWQGNVRPDGLYVADDHFLPLLTAWMRDRNLTPGRDLQIITLSNQGGYLPPDVAWSCLEFNPTEMGALAAESMIRAIHSAGGAISSFRQLATWRPGTTHLHQ